MADLPYIDSTLEVKIAGQDGTGNNINYVSADTHGNMLVKEYANGPVTPGTAAPSSLLIGGQYNTTLPTLTNTQQSALQLDLNGRLFTNSNFNKNIKIEPTFTTIAIPSSVTYTTIYSYSGSGCLIGFNYEFNSTSIVVKVVIDGNTVMDGVDIGQYNSLAVTAGSSARYQQGEGIISASTVIDFSMRHPISYASSIVISARLTSGAVSKNFNQGIVYIQKDT